MKSNLIALITALCFAVVLFGCGTNSSKFEIASAEYSQLTEKYLQHIANFEWEESYALLADEVEFKLPDGDVDTRTVVKGLDQVKKFWSNHETKSGNDGASLTNFVHIPVQVNESIENVDLKGAFDICYFSAELNYGKEKAKVRMHWAFHFNSDNKIDLINAYYDRTPIIEAANRNILTKTKKPNAMIVQIVKLKSSLPEEELLTIAKERAEQFKVLPGLIQKYYTRTGAPGEYCGVYIWESKEDLINFKNSELAATIKSAYQVTGEPNIEVADLLFQLRD